MTRTRTYRDIFGFINAASRWIESHKEDSKLKYALVKLVKKLAKHSEDYREAIEELNVDNCSVNDKGHILREGENYVFTKDGQKARDKGRRALLDKEVVIEPHYVAELPDDLAQDMRVMFEGFVLPVPDEDTPLKLVEKPTV